MLGMGAARDELTTTPIHNAATNSTIVTLPLILIILTTPWLAETSAKDLLYYFRTQRNDSPSTTIRSLFFGVPLGAKVSGAWALSWFLTEL